MTTEHRKWFALEIAQTYLRASMASRGWVANQVEVVSNGRSKWLPVLDYGRCTIILNGQTMTVKHVDHLLSFTFTDIREAVTFAEQWAKWGKETK